MSSASASSASPVILMDPFCLKQFAPAPAAGGQHISIPCAADDFARRTNEWFAANPQALQGGYAPFCKHLFIPASTFAFSAKVPCAYAPITDANRAKLESTYSARTEKELPVLTRFFSRGAVDAPDATFIDVILYSRAQIAKENAAMASKPTTSSAAAPAADSTSKSPSADPAPKLLSDSLSTAGLAAQDPSSTWEWGIVSLKPQSVAHETPMNPITIMRNALGVEEGGSGIPLDREAYLKSVAFWQAHAIVQ